MTYLELPGLLTEKECDNIVHQLVNREQRYKYGKNNAKALYQRPEEDAELAEWVYQKLLTCTKTKEFLQQSEIQKCSEKITFSHYYPGQFVAPHQDQQWKSDHLISGYTLVIYLNSLPTGGGGETVLYSLTEKGVTKHQVESVLPVAAVIKAEKGKGFLFDICHWHKSNPSNSEKFVIGVKLMA